jgi:hypothetical protein
MKLTEIQAEVESLKTSSAFRSGDASTFGVRIVELEAELPGPCDPETYMDLVKRKLGVTIQKNDRVLVIGAGNGGLCAEALLAGASEVLACEPRYRYSDAIEKITKLLDDVHEAPVCRTYRGWPVKATVAALGRFDLILWPESLDECQNPAETVTSVLQMLKADGRAVIEVTHGAHGIPAGKTNSFLPTEAAWNGLIEDLTGKGPSGATVGRSGGRMIYGIGRDAKVGKAKATPLSSLPPFPKESLAPPAKPETVEPPQQMGLPPFPKDAHSVPTPAPDPAAIQDPILETGLPAFPRDPAPATSHRVGSNLPPVDETSEILAREPAAAPSDLGKNVFADVVDEAGFVDSAPEASADAAPEPVAVDVPAEESVPVSLPEPSKEEATPLTLPTEDAE